MFLNKINVNKLDNIKYFVFCSGKTGSRTLFGGMKNKFGSNSVIHVHGTPHFNTMHHRYGNLKDLIINNK
jgi:hypothetical protein